MDTGEQLQLHTQETKDNRQVFLKFHQNANSSDHYFFSSTKLSIVRMKS